MLKTVNILSIEDNKGSSYLVKSVFKQSRLDVDVQFSDSVHHALSVVERAEVLGSQPDIILLDLSMPKEDGWVFLDKYYEMNIKKRSVIFILSTSINLKDQFKAKDYEGVVRFYHKPMTLSKSHEIYDTYYEILSKNDLK